MKRLTVWATVVAMLLTSCADSKTFRKSDGKEFVAQPYGWMDKENKIDGVEYELCTGNIVWSVLLSETIVAPVLFTGLALWEPVLYNEPKDNGVD